jgi:hypothetical protein
VHALDHAGPANYEVAVAPATAIVLLIHLRLCRSLEPINLNTYSRPVVLGAAFTKNAEAAATAHGLLPNAQPLLGP